MISAIKTIFVLACLTMLGYTLYRGFYQAGVEQQAARNFQTDKYSSTAICEDAWKNELRPAPNVDHFDITLHDGCFSGNIYLPRRFYDHIGSAGFHWQPLDAGPNWWIAIWFQGGWPAFGPFGINQMPDYSSYKPGVFRLQGHGRVRIYTNNDPLEYPEKNITPP